MSIPSFFTIGTVLLITSMPLLSCSGKRSANLGISNFKLAPCPSSPNCVSSDNSDKDHNIAHFQLVESSTETWQIARDLVSELPRAQIVNVTLDYIHAECRSRVFGFVDDLELHFRPSAGIIAVRSAARLGYSDFGVNRRRVETLRATLTSRGMVR